MVGFVAELMNASDAARVLGVSHQYVAKLARKGKLAGVRFGKFRFFERDVVEEFAKRRAETSQNSKAAE